MLSIINTTYIVFMTVQFMNNLDCQSQITSSYFSYHIETLFCSVTASCCCWKFLGTSDIWSSS